MTDTDLPGDHVDRIRAEWSRERPELDTTPIGVIGRLHRLALRLTAELETVYRRHGLGEGDFDVLSALRRVGSPYERRPSEIAEHTMVTTGAVTKRLDRLEAAGLVQRRASETDGRGRVVALTAEGARVIDEAFTEHVANEARLLAAVPPADRAALERILRTWLTTLP